VLVLVTATVSVIGSAWTDKVVLGVTCDGVLSIPRPQASRLGNDNNKIVVSFFNVFSDLTIFTHDFALQWSVAGRPVRV